MKEIITIGYIILVSELISIKLEVKLDKVYFNWNSFLRNLLLLNNII